MRRTYCAIFFIQCVLINICLGNNLTDENKQRFLNGFIDSLNNLPDQPYTYEDGVILSAEKTVTSGEQFVAIPKVSPATPCIGCASHVDPQAAGVSVLARLGIRHLDLHDPGVRHVLSSVVAVERQVQVVNGVRYILTLLVDYNNCTASGAEPCVVKTPCKISILEKPWKKLPDGSKYRAIVANNCTAEWQFGDDGEVLPAEENNELYPDSDDNLRVVHNYDTQAQPNQEKPITDEALSHLQQQIIPHSEFGTTPNHIVPETRQSVQGLENTGQTHTDETPKQDAAPVQQNNEPNALSGDKKKAIDDIMNFFNFAGLHKPELDSNLHQKSRRSYDPELKVLALAKKFQKVKRFIDNANYIHNLAQTMVDYLNQLDMVVKNRILKDVVAAEEETENDQHLFYIQALITIPCTREQCRPEDNINKICNGVIDSTDEKLPKILNSFCYNDEKELIANKAEEVSFDDPVLVKLAKQALKKIESESAKDNALKIVRILDATTQRTSGILTRISMSLAYTDCKKSLELYKRLNCRIVQDLGAKVCDVTIHEKKAHKNIDSKVLYVCTERAINESFSYTNLFKQEKVVNVIDPQIQNMVHEAIQFLEIQSNRNNKQKLVNIKSVSTKLVGGLLTDIAFIVGYTDCQNDKNEDINTCQLLRNETFRNCKAQVWDRPWLEDGRQVNVKCDARAQDIDNSQFSDFRKDASVKIYHRLKREMLIGGQTEQNTQDPKYMVLAKESLQKYRQRAGASKKQRNDEAIRIAKVTTQVVSGTTTTRIDFLVGQDKICRSKVMEQPWRNIKDITVHCKARAKKSTVEKDPNDPQFKKLAKESLQKYLMSSGKRLKNKAITVTIVIAKVDGGNITHEIDFRGDEFQCHSKVFEQPRLKKKDITVNCKLNNDNQSPTKPRVVKKRVVIQKPNEPRYKAMAEESLQKYITSSGKTLNNKAITVTRVIAKVDGGNITHEIDFRGDEFQCHSEVFERGNKKDITVICTLNNDKQSRPKQQIYGSKIEKDPNDPKYKALAEESLQKYITSSGNSFNNKAITVTKVTVQVVAGTITRIDFRGDEFQCHSKVWEQSWLNKKDITVICKLNNDNQSPTKPRVVKKRVVIQKPNEPRYKAMAEESLQKYITSSGKTLNNKAITVTRVIAKVDGGNITHEIDFRGDEFQCHSEVFEQPRLKKKDITVNCKLNNDNQSPTKPRVVKKRVVIQKPNEPRYKAMAEESLQKYITSSGKTLNNKAITVTRVIAKVDGGNITHEIDFRGDEFQCHSEVFEQPRLKKKDITVNCKLNNYKLSLPKRQIPGGHNEQDPNDPKYKALAEESLQKYITSSGNSFNNKAIKVTKVTVQVVAGTITRIDFRGDEFQCHSEVFEQPWLNKKDITVICTLNNDKQSRAKRQIPGGHNEKDPNDPKYKALAEESLQKYITSSGNSFNNKAITVTKVTVQVVAGTMTLIDFKGDEFQCHSEVWEQPWLNKKEITVNCTLNNRRKVKREILSTLQTAQHGAHQKEDPSQPNFKLLADESLWKYMKLQHSKVLHKVVEVNHVRTQVKN